MVSFVDGEKRVFRLLRQGGPKTQAEICRVLGLQMSVVGNAVMELVAKGRVGLGCSRVCLVETKESPTFYALEQLPGKAMPSKIGSFNGEVYDPKFDDQRLKKQLGRVFSCMRDGEWRTLSEIESLIGDPQASVSAQLRHLRKKKFGAYVVNKRPRGERSLGLFEYQLLSPVGELIC